MGGGSTGSTPTSSNNQATRIQQSAHLPPELTQLLGQTTPNVQSISNILFRLLGGA